MPGRFPLVAVPITGDPFCEDGYCGDPPPPAPPAWRLLPNTANRILFNVVQDEAVSTRCDGGAGVEPASSTTGYAGFVIAPFAFIEVGNLAVVEYGIGGTVGAGACVCGEGQYTPRVEVPVRSATGVVAILSFTYSTQSCSIFIDFAFRQMSRYRTIDFYELVLTKNDGQIVATLPSTGGVVPP